MHVPDACMLIHYTIVRDKQLTVALNEIMGGNTSVIVLQLTCCSGISLNVTQQHSNLLMRLSH